MSNRFVGVLVVLGATVSAAPTRFVYQPGALGQTTSTPAEETPSGKSVLCGQLIKKAYFTGQAQ